MTDQDKFFYDKLLDTERQIAETYKNLYKRVAAERDALVTMLAELEPKQ